MTDFWNQLDESFILTIDVKMTGQVFFEKFSGKDTNIGIFTTFTIVNQTALHPRLKKK
jgi:hypothetical protein